MAKPLRSDDPAPQNMQFSHFGVLNDGNQSKGSLFSAIVLNVVIAIVVCIIGAAAKAPEGRPHQAEDRPAKTSADARRQGRSAENQAPRRQASRSPQAARDQDGAAASHPRSRAAKDRDA